MVLSGEVIFCESFQEISSSKSTNISSSDLDGNNFFLKSSTVKMVARVSEFSTDFPNTKIYMPPTKQKYEGHYLEVNDVQKSPRLDIFRM